MTLVLSACLGLALGVAAGIALLRRSGTIRAEGLYRTWRAEEAAAMTRSAAAGGRLTAKAGVGAELSGGTLLPFLAADAHFLGHPVHLVVFDGDSEVKAGVLDDLRAIVLVTVEQEAGPGHEISDAALIAECVADGRVRWETVRYPGA